MKILILGATGMLGHMACRLLQEHHQVSATLRSLPPPDHVLRKIAPSVDFHATGPLTNDDRIDQIVEQIRPDVVVNCIGVIKQSDHASDAITTIALNSLFPHLVARICSSHGARFIQISTDCVFSGRRGQYRIDDLPDPVDLYGRSKLVGEVTASPHLTLRTSIIGRQLAGKESLLEWFISQRGSTVRGFTSAIYSGYTTQAFCEILEDIIVNHKDLSGLHHVASEPISKYLLLTKVNDLLKLDIQVTPEDSFKCDRSLVKDDYFNNHPIPDFDWETMLDQFCKDAKQYEYWRK